MEPCYLQSLGIIEVLLYLLELALKALQAAVPALACRPP
jgi:hypothetical protein